MDLLDEGGGSKKEEPIYQDYQGQDHWWGASFYLDETRPPLTSQVLTAAQSDRARSQVPGSPGRAELGAVSQALIVACQGREASDDSLPLTLVSKPDTKRRRRAERKGESTSALLDKHPDRTDYQSDR